jgi:hypothetical protein
MFAIRFVPWHATNMAKPGRLNEGVWIWARRYSRDVENRMTRMRPDELDALLRGED